MLINEVLNHNLINPGDISNIRISKKFVGVSKYIQNHCSDILKMYKETNHYIYRGFRDIKKEIFMGNPRIDRQPKDVDYDTQISIDKKLKEAGFTALRSNSIFCTCDEDRAKLYGKLYVIFPINGFNYTWSSSLYDLYVRQGSVRDSFNLTPKQFVHTWNFKNTGIKNLLNSGNGLEIYISGPYIAVERDFFYGKPDTTKPLLDILGLKI